MAMKNGKSVDFGYWYENVYFIVFEIYCVECFLSLTIPKYHEPHPTSTKVHTIRISVAWNDTIKCVIFCNII